MDEEEWSSQYNHKKVGGGRCKRMCASGQLDLGGKARERAKPVQQRRETVAKNIWMRCYTVKVVTGFVYRALG